MLVEDPQIEAVGDDLLTLCFFHHGTVFLLIVRHTFDEAIHVEGIQLTAVSLVLAWPAQILSIRVKKTGLATHEGSPYFVGVEGCRADERDTA